MLVGVRNFRDFGGFQTAEGSRVRTGRLFRSASLSDATEADLEILDRLDIGLHVDLRRLHERRAKPSRWRRDGVDLVVNDEDTRDDSDLLRDGAFFGYLSSPDASPDGARQRMKNLYAAAPYDPVLVDLYRHWFQRLAHSTRPALVNCAAGKDRTGILCALTLDMLGVHRADIMADYERTNPAIFDHRLEDVQKRFQEQEGRQASTEVLKHFLRAEPEYLHSAWRAIEERSGSATEYITGTLGLEPQMFAQLKTRLVE